MKKARPLQGFGLASNFFAVCLKAEAPPDGMMAMMMPGMGAGAHEEISIARGRDCWPKNSC